MCVYLRGRKLVTTVIWAGRWACVRYRVVFAQERSTVCMFMGCCVQGNLYQQLEWDCGVWGIVCPDASNCGDLGSMASYWMECVSKPSY